MTVEEILLRLIDDLRTTLAPFDESPMHKLCGPDCDICELGERLAEDVEAAELELERLRLGITKVA